MHGKHASELYRRADALLVDWIETANAAAFLLELKERKMNTKRELKRQKAAARPARLPTAVESAWFLLIQMRSD